MIISIDRYFVGEPNIVGIVTSDNLSTITTAGYWTTQIPIVSQLINGLFQWSLSDLVLIYYATNQVGFFTFDPINLTFVELIVPGDVSSITATSPLLANGVSGSQEKGDVIISAINPYPINDGGTGVQSVTISPTATAFAGWDANKNMSANNFLSAGNSIISAAGTTILTNTSPYYNIVTGSTTKHTNAKCYNVGFIYFFETR